jgi:hypothetical protein
VAVCRPVTTPPVLISDEEALDEEYAVDSERLQQTGRWNVFFARPAAEGDRHPPVELFAWRCGHRRPVRVSACRDSDCMAFAARSNLVLWPARRGLRMMDLAKGHRGFLAGPSGIRHVAVGAGRRIFASVEESPLTHETTVYVTRVH